MALNRSAQGAATPVDQAEAEAVLGYAPRGGQIDARIIGQDTYWVTAVGKVLRIADMPAGYAANAAALLLDRADGITTNTEAVFEEGSERVVLGKQAVLDSVLYAALVARSEQPDS